MNTRNWRAGLVAVLSMALVNVGFVNVASAGIADTGSMIQTSRSASLASIQSQLSRDDVRAQLTRFGVSSQSIDQRLATLSDSELAALSKRMSEAPAGGDGLLALIGVVFVVLLILELVGVIDIFKKT